jgi:rhodanese-related sulfurtransferase
MTPRMAHSARFLKICDESRARIREVSVDQVKARLAAGETFYLVDTREDREVEAGRIKGAVHIGKGVIERDIEAAIPDLDADIVLYCGGGFRSAIAAESLQKMGYTRVASMDGGFRGWKAADGPTE